MTCYNHRIIEWKLITHLHTLHQITHFAPSRMKSHPSNKPQSSSNRRQDQAGVPPLPPCLQGHQPESVPSMGRTTSSTRALKSEQRAFAPFFTENYYYVNDLTKELMSLCLQQGVKMNPLTEFLLYPRADTWLIYFLDFRKNWRRQRYIFNTCSTALATLPVGIREQKRARAWALLPADPTVSLPTGALAWPWPRPAIVLPPNASVPHHRWQLRWRTVPGRPYGSGLPVLRERHVHLDTVDIPHHFPWGSSNKHWPILFTGTKTAI